MVIIPVWVVLVVVALTVCSDVLSTVVPVTVGLCVESVVELGLGVDCVV